MDLLETLITSKTRIKLLIRFFSHPSKPAYLRGLEGEINDSTNAIRLELLRFENDGLLLSYTKGNRKFYTANVQHPLYPCIQNMVLQIMMISHIINHIILKVDNLQKVVILGDMPVKGLEGELSLLFVGNHINKKRLEDLVEKARKKLECKIKYITKIRSEIEKYLEQNKDIKTYVLWEN